MLMRVPLTRNAEEPSHHDLCASVIGSELVRPRASGTRTFVLQGHEDMENGKIKGTWFVVPVPERAIFRTAR